MKVPFSALHCSSGSFLSNRGWTDAEELLLTAEVNQRKVTQGFTIGTCKWT